jgi:serine/threonine protein kinase
MEPRPPARSEDVAHARRHAYAARVRLSVGQTFDQRYALKRLVTRAEGGVVFEASHLYLDRVVAVRIVDGAASAPRRALLGEARLLDRARHPSVLRVLDSADGADGAYLVSEVPGGRPLDGVLAVRKVLAIDESVAIALAIADALAHAHAFGIAHAGLCSSSVVLAEQVSEHFPTPARLLDFGVSPWPSALGGALGAMPYAAPERLAGAPASPATDVYALGALLFEMITGELPSGRRDRASVIALRPETPVSVADAIASALATADARAASMGAMIDALRSATKTPLPRSLPPPMRRTHPRAAYVTPVRVKRPNGATVDGRTEDISEGGLLVLANAPTALREEVLVRFALPSSHKMVSLAARVRWTREVRPGTHAFGVQFDDPGDKVREDIASYARFVARDPEK